MSGWIGVDLDGTLAHYDGWKGPAQIGAPIPAMMARVRGWLATGRTVKIFTARIAVPEPDRSAVVRTIHEWLEAHGLPRLDITNVKDIAMAEVWDDRAVQVIPNTGDFMRSLAWQKASDGLPRYDAEFGERWLLSWSERSATYDLSCIDGGWSHGEEIAIMGADLWVWLEMSPSGTGGGHR